MSTIKSLKKSAKIDLGEVSLYQRAHGQDLGYELSRAARLATEHQRPMVVYISEGGQSYRIKWPHVAVTGQTAIAVVYQDGAISPPTAERIERLRAAYPAA